MVVGFPFLEYGFPKMGKFLHLGVEFCVNQFESDPFLRLEFSKMDNFEVSPVLVL